MFANVLLVAQCPPLHPVAFRCHHLRPVVPKCLPPRLCFILLFMCRCSVIPRCLPLPPVASLLLRQIIPASLQLARCLPLPSAASRCLPLPPVVSRCLWLCSHDLPLSPAASHCLSLPPAVSRCLPLSPVGPRSRTLFRVASRCLLSYPKLWASICRCLTPFAGRKNDIR